MIAPLIQKCSSDIWQLGIQIHHIFTTTNLFSIGITGSFGQLQRNVTILNQNKGSNIRHTLWNIIVTQCSKDGQRGKFRGSLYIG